MNRCRLPPAHSRKPDPAEPWRYVCPDCGRHVQGAENTRKFRCVHCGESFDKDELHDKAGTRPSAKE